jgi:hypothetical protein
MAGSRIPALTILTAAASANDDDFVVFDTSEDITVRISRSQLAIALAPDLPSDPVGNFAQTTLDTLVQALATAVSAALDTQGYIVVKSATAAAIADVADAINTTNKAIGRAVLDTTNHRIMTARGTAAADPWDVADGSASVTPA